MRFLSSIAAAVLATATFTSAQLQDTPFQDYDPSVGQNAPKIPANQSQPAAYFVYGASVDGFVFTLNAEVNTGDLYIHMHSAWNRTWIGAGFGTGMKDSLMVISYIAANQADVITTARWGSGHSEPELLDTQVIQYYYDDQYAPNANKVKRKGFGNLISHVVCRGCGKRAGLNYTNTQQPMFFAMGPVGEMFTNDTNASLQRHEVYGHFTMDMTVASSNGTGRIPCPNLWNSSFVSQDNIFGQHGASNPIDVHFDSDKGIPVHAALMLIAFVFIFPAGVLVLRIVKSVMLHLIAQCIGLVFVAGGFGTAIWISSEYNRSKHYQDPHQILGFLVMAFLLIQLGLGLAHHLIFKKKNTAPKQIRYAHLILGPSLMVLALINGGLGFILSQRSNEGLIYAIIVSIAAVIFFCIRAWLWFRASPRRYRPEDDTDKINPYAAADFYAAQERGQEDEFDEFGALKSPFLTNKTFNFPTSFPNASPYGDRKGGFEMQVTAQEVHMPNGEVFVPIPKAYYNDHRAG